MSRTRVFVLIAATRVFNRVARFAGTHPNVVLQAWLALGALALCLAMLGVAALISTAARVLN